MWAKDSVESDRRQFMFASYNAGRGTIRSAQEVARKDALDHRLWPSIESVAPRVRRWRHEETIGYVRKIDHNLQKLDHKGKVTRRK
jgi:membrane-bound lytic murein transglycosylase MltF